MIGKVIRILVGRSIAKKHGYNGWAGAAAGLIAPTVLKKGGSLIKKRRAAAKEARRRREEPVYLPPLT